jgi:GNAT superfamily N-acetyltransferase
VTGDDAIARAAGNCAEAYRRWVEGVGRPWRIWDDLVVADMGLAVSLPPNHASVLEPLTDAAVPGVVERMRDFFDGSPGGPFELWSAWPTPDLASLGFEPWSVPLMLRQAGGSPPPTPPELEIGEVDDDPSAADASALLAVFGTPVEDTAGRINPGLASDTDRIWHGRVGGKPASLAAASVSHGFVGVYAVATAPEFRGRGYGEALSWKATMFRPGLPATLQASPMGRPVYERMGYSVAAMCSNWTIERR